jgi:hypothetical protein
MYHQRIGHKSQPRGKKVFQKGAPLCHSFEGKTTIVAVQRWHHARGDLFLIGNYCLPAAQKGGQKVDKTNIPTKKGLRINRNPLIFLVGMRGFEPPAP